MRTQSALFLAAAAGVACASDDAARWAQFKRAHGKSYASAAEHDARFGVFVGNLRLYEARSAADKHATFGPDRFADLAPEEFRAQQGGCFHQAPVAPRDYSAAEVAGQRAVIAAAGGDGTIDWRDDKHRAVTPAKDQGAFGDCWAFGASGVMEGIHVAQGGGNLTALCEQELIDCCAPCNGAGPGESWDYLINNTHGFLDTEASYPYKGDKPAGKCRPPTAVVSDAKVSSWKIVQQDKGGSQDAFLAEMIKSGPCNIGVDASCLSGYVDGVITNCTGKDVDHANVIVGAGTMPPSEGSVDYFIVKNSWGAGWGNQGFYKVARNTGQMKIDACWHAYV